jgi:hypothetical protein
VGALREDAPRTIVAYAMKFIRDESRVGGGSVLVHRPFGNLNVSLGAYGTAEAMPLSTTKNGFADCSDARLLSSVQTEGFGWMMLRMSEAAKSGSVLIPSLRYKDAPAAIAWLERAFGFERHAVYEGPEGTVAHAELSFGSGMIMLGSATNPGPYTHLYATPQEIGGRVTSPLYLIVPDCVEGDGVWREGV